MPGNPLAQSAMRGRGGYRGRGVRGVRGGRGGLGRHESVMPVEDIAEDVRSLQGLPFANENTLGEFGSLEEESGQERSGDDDFHDPNLPGETLTHILRYIAGQIEGVHAEWVLRNIRQRSYARGIPTRWPFKPFLLAPRSPNTAAMEMEITPSGIQQLPDELLFPIIEQLDDPRDMVCLSLTCRAFFLKMDYQLREIHHLDLLAHQLGFGRRTVRPRFRASLRQLRYDITERIDRSRLSVLERRESGRVHANGILENGPKSTWLCATCLELHPGAFFSEPQLRGEPSARLCLAAESKITLCEDRYEDLASLRAMRRAVLCDPWPKRITWYYLRPPPGHQSPQPRKTGCGRHRRDTTSYKSRSVFISDTCRMRISYGVGEAFALRSLNDPWEDEYLMHADPSGNLRALRDTVYAQQEPSSAKRSVPTALGGK